MVSMSKLNMIEPIKPDFVRFVRVNTNDDFQMKTHSNLYCITLCCKTSDKGILVWASPEMWRQTSRAERRLYASSSLNNTPCILVPHRMIRRRGAVTDPVNRYDLITAWKMRLLSWADQGNTRQSAWMRSQELSLASLATLVDQFNYEQTPMSFGAIIPTSTRVLADQERNLYEH